MDQSLEKLKASLENDSLSDQTKNNMLALEKSIKADEKKMIKKYSREISELLELEISSRFLLEKDIISKYLDNDKCVSTAINLMKSKKYNQILAIEKNIDGLNDN